MEFSPGCTNAAFTNADPGVQQAMTAFMNFGDEARRANREWRRCRCLQRRDSGEYRARSGELFGCMWVEEEEFGGE